MIGREGLQGGGRGEHGWVPNDGVYRGHWFPGPGGGSLCDPDDLTSLGVGHTGVLCNPHYKYIIVMAVKYT